MALSKETLDILEEENVDIMNLENDPQYDWELGFHSDLGEDVIEYVKAETDSEFAEAVRKLAEEFDPEEHAELYISSRGKNGVPDSIRDLLNDAQGIKEFLTDLSDKLSGKERVKKKNVAFLSKESLYQKIAEEEEYARERFLKAEKDTEQRSASGALNALTWVKLLIADMEPDLIGSV